MNHGGKPAGWGPVRAGVRALAIFAVAAPGTGGVAWATSPNAGGVPPEHAEGDGKPEAPPAAQQAGGDAHGMTGGGHSKARGNGHTGSVGQAKSGGSAQSNAGKVTLCHATGSETNPYVTITISANAMPAHDAHQDGQDIIPAPGGGCPGGSQSGGPENENGKVTPRGETPGPGGQGPAGAVLGVSEENGSAPGDDEGENAVLGANQGGGEEGAARETTGTSLPFTGLGLGLLAAIGLLLALSGGHLRRKAS